MSQNSIKILFAVSMFIAYISIVTFIKDLFYYNEINNNVDLKLVLLLMSVLSFSLVSNHLLNKIKL